MSEREDAMDKIAEGIYNKSLELWFKVSPYRNTNRGHPGVPSSYNDRLAYVDGAIRTLQEAREGLMEETFPKLKDVRNEQEAFWDKMFPGCK
jgi:hypothetical protein